jgi:hypothetical protein
MAHSAEIFNVKARLDVEDHANGQRVLGLRMQARRRVVICGREADAMPCCKSSHLLLGRHEVAILTVILEF